MRKYILILFKRSKQNPHFYEIFRGDIQEQNMMLTLDHLDVSHLNVQLRLKQSRILSGGNPRVEQYEGSVTESLNSLTQSTSRLSIEYNSLTQFSSLH
jgi:hypothetical protein